MYVVMTKTFPSDVLQRQWPQTDFSQYAVDLKEIIFGGLSKDDIPVLDNPVLTPVKDAGFLADDEEILSVSNCGYPLRYLAHHQIINHTVGDRPIVVTHCPLSGVSAAYDRRAEEKVLEFSATGLLRFSNMVMADRQTGSWWQQITGEAILGHHSRTKLQRLPSSMESLRQFRARESGGKLCIPKDPQAARYSFSPYLGYGESGWPFFYQGEYHAAVPPFTEVVIVEGQAWTLPRLRHAGVIKTKELELHWVADAEAVNEKAFSTGAIRVLKGGRTIPYIKAYAFAFEAFYPGGTLHSE